MKLSDLLDELRSNILYDRHESTGNDDRLWSDTALVRYINESQRRLAKRGLVIRDGTTAEVCNVTLVAGQTEYVLHPSILAIVSARMSDSAVDLTRFGHTALATYSSPSTLFWDPSAITWPDGHPLAFSTDEYLSEDDEGTVATVTMRVYPTPRAEDAGDIIKLRVIRMPLDELTENNLSAIPEVPADHHMEMLDYAAYLALRIVDVDAGNAVRAEGFRQSFERSVKEARNLILKKLFAPQQWGFGRGGWSWGASDGCN
jgi:hypothetical protein